jgi:hypothetical protein
VRCCLLWAAGCGGVGVRQGSIPLKWAEGEQLMTLKPKPELELTKDAVHLEPLRKHLQALHHRYLSRHAER